MKRKATDDVCETIFQKNFVPRRKALLLALTEELQLLVEKCDPASDEHVCLYASSEGTWEVKEPVQHLPTIPEPYIGVNKTMLEYSLMQWVRFVARWSDSWLMTYAFFMEPNLNAEQRASLFWKINSLKTIVEELDIYYSPKKKKILQHVENVEKVYNMKVKPQGISDDTHMQFKETTNSGGRVAVENEKATEKATENGINGVENDTQETTNNGGIVDVENKKAKRKGVNGVKDKQPVKRKKKYFCGICNEEYVVGESFWIECSVSDCKKWFHGSCVDVLTEKQQNELKKKFWKCPLCTLKEKSKK